MISHGVDWKTESSQLAGQPQSLQHCKGELWGKGVQCHHYLLTYWTQLIHQSRWSVDWKCYIHLRWSCYFESAACRRKLSKARARVVGIFSCCEKWTLFVLVSLIASSDITQVGDHLQMWDCCHRPSLTPNLHKLFLQWMWVQPSLKSVSKVLRGRSFPLYSSDNWATAFIQDILRFWHSDLWHRDIVTL